jgi:hypothetical protein
MRRFAVKTRECRDFDDAAWQSPIGKCAFELRPTEPKDSVRMVGEESFRSLKNPHTRERCRIEICGGKRHTEHINST